jgi:hypothetical protein
VLPMHGAEAACVSLLRVNPGDAEPDLISCNPGASSGIIVSCSLSGAIGFDGSD